MDWFMTTVQITKTNPNLIVIKKPEHWNNERAF